MCFRFSESYVNSAVFLFSELFFTSANDNTFVLQDYRVSKGLMKSCKEDIKKYHCRKQTSDDKAIRLAQVLLCLENLLRNGTKIEEDCEAEMRDHRRILMEDYRLSPEIINGCSMEIKKFCNELEVGGKTIHCLMGVARIEHGKKIRPVCERAVSDKKVFEKSDNT